MVQILFQDNDVHKFDLEELTACKDNVSPPLSPALVRACCLVLLPALFLALSPCLALSLLLALSPFFASLAASVSCVRSAPLCFFLVIRRSQRSMGWGRSSQICRYPKTRSLWASTYRAGVLRMTLLGPLPMPVSAQGREGEVESSRDGEKERRREGEGEREDTEDREDRDERTHIESYTH